MNPQKYYLYLVLPLFTVLFISCNKEEEPEVHQILNNSDMESEVYGMPRYWNWESNGNTECTWDSLEFTSPTHSLKISSIDSVGYDLAYWSQRVTYIEHGKDLKLRVNVKGIDLVGRSPVIVVHAFNTTSYGGEFLHIASNEDTDNNQIIGTFDWKTYEVVVENIKSNVRSIWVLLFYRYDTLGTVYFDDVTATYSDL